MRTAIDADLAKMAQDKDYLISKYAELVRKQFAASAHESEMAHDQDHLREADLITEEFATADMEVELFRQRGEKLDAPPQGLQ